MVEGARQRDHRPHGRPAFGGHDAVFRRADGDDGRLRWVQDGREALDGVHAEVRDRERPALEVLGAQLAVAGPADEIGAQAGDLVSRARDNKLKADDLEGGTFTISNLGMYDVDVFTAVLNPPQASIVAVGQTRDMVVPRDGDLHVLPIMTMTLTCDHRAVDGATGAEFLKSLKAMLQDPGLAL